MPAAQIRAAGGGFVPATAVTFAPQGGLRLIAPQGGYELTLADGAKKHVQGACPKNISLNSGWVVNFPEGFGTPPSMTMDHLMDLSKSDDAGAKYFSGTASCLKTITLEPEQTQDGLLVTLNLGEVGDGAAVIVNGKNVCTLWAYPFTVDITPYVDLPPVRYQFLS